MSCGSGLVALFGLGLAMFSVIRRGLLVIGDVPAVEVAALLAGGGLLRHAAFYVG